MNLKPAIIKLLNTHHVSLFIKLTLTLIILVWLYSNNNLDLTILIETSTPTRWLYSLALLILNLFIINYRWKLLLEKLLNVPFSYLVLLKASWIGLFFNSFLPGAYSGDFVKIFYIQDKKEKNKELLFSILLDRGFGFTALTIISSLSLFLVYQNQNFTLNRNLYILTFVLMLISIVFFIACISSKTKRIFLKTFDQLKSIIKKTNSNSSENKVHSKTHEKNLNNNNTALLSFTDLFKIISLSLSSQFLTLLSFWYLAYPAMTFSKENLPPISFLEASQTISLGFLVKAIPVSFNGLGTGNIAFHELFKIYGVTNGASLFNFSYVLSLLIGLLGIIPFLLSQKRLKK